MARSMAQRTQSPCPAYERTGELADLDRAIEAFEQAVALTPDGSPDLPRHLNNLGNGLSYRYGRTGELADLVRAIEAFEQAVALTPDGSPDLPGRLTNLGNGLKARYGRTGKRVDLVRAIETCEEAVELTPEGSPEMPPRLNNLGNGLSYRYGRTGELADLDRAIEAFEQVVELTPEGSPDLPGYLNNLGNGLSYRYGRTGELADLVRAIEAFEQAVTLTPDGSPKKAIILNNLGNGLNYRYWQTGELADLARAIEAYEQAVALTPEGSPEMPRHLTNLGNGLSERYGRTEELADFARAIEAFEQAVALTPEGSPGLPSRLNNLGTGLWDCYERTEELADLARAIEAYEQAVELTPEGSPEKVAILNNLGTGLKARYGRTGDLADLARAIEAYEGACGRGKEIALEEDLRAARNWGGWALEREEWGEATRAYSYGLEASERLFRVQLLRASKEAWLREARGLHARAAYALAKTGSAPQAVEAMEQGRARLLGQVLERDRADLAQLERLSPEFHQRYLAAANQLQALEAQEISEQIALPPGQTLTEAIRQTRAELDSAVESIRQVPDYEGFLKLPTLEQVRAATEEGWPMAYLAATPAGAVGLVVSAEGEVEAVWSELTENELSQLLIQSDDTQRKGYLPAQFGQASMHVALSELLPTLGKQLVAPLAEKLREMEAKRVTLIPCGLLGLVPLHAARYQWDGQETCLLNEFDVVYAPSATVLGTAQQALAEREETTPVLAGVGNPLENPRPLQYARPELEEVVGLFPGGTAHRVLYEHKATKEGLMEALPGATYVHLSCHGVFDSDEPLNSHLQLADESPFTLREVLAAEYLADARLVVLSACQTAITDFNNLPDEVIGLPAGFFQAGAPGVVGTLWSVNDLSTMLLMVRFYEYHLQGDEKTDEGPMPPARALRRAQRWLRDVTNEELSELFKEYKETSPDRPVESRMAYELAQEKFTKYALEYDRGKRPFARPYYWAGFVFYGV